MGARAGSFRETVGGKAEAIPLTKVGPARTLQTGSMIVAERAATRKGTRKEDVHAKGVQQLPEEYEAV